MYVRLRMFDTAKVLFTGIFKNKKKYIREQTEIELNKALENDELN